MLSYHLPKVDEVIWNWEGRSGKFVDEREPAKRFEVTVEEDFSLLD